MRLLPLLSLLCLCGTCFFAAPAVGQQAAPAVNGLASAPAQAAVSLYHQTLGRNAPLYVGPEYPDIRTRIQGHQFFLTDDWQRGSILFDGVLYPDVPMLYDVAYDQLVIGYAEETDPIIKFTLIPDRVHSFTLPKHHFINLQDSTGTLASGFYEQLYKGQVQLLAKRRKTILKRPADTEFYESDRFYLLKGGRFHTVKTKGSVLKVLKDRKKELTSFLRTENLNFKQQRAESILKLVQQYDKVSAPQ